VSTRARRIADNALKQVALECYQKARAIREPVLVRQDAEEALGALVKDIRHGLNWPRHGEAYKLLKERWPVLIDGSHIDRDKNIIDWTVRLMMDRLLEWSMFDPEKRCESECRTCRKCQRALVFPYKWKKKDAARAAKAGFEQAKIQPYETPHWTVDAILKIYQRHPARH
jgi:hypothetical protein